MPQILQEPNRGFVNEKILNGEIYEGSFSNPTPGH